MPYRRRLKGRKIAVLAADGFEKVELVIPLRALKLAGAKVDVLSLRRGRIRGVNLHLPASRVGVDKTVSEADPDDYDGLLPPGSMRGSSGTEPRHEQRTSGHGGLRPRNARCLREDLAGAEDDSAGSRVRSAAQRTPRPGRRCDAVAAEAVSSHGRGGHRFGRCRPASPQIATAEEDRVLAGLNRPV